MLVYKHLFILYIFICKFSITESQVLSPFSIGLGKEHPYDTFLRIRRLGLNPGSTLYYLCHLEQGIHSYDTCFPCSFNEDDTVGPLYLQTQNPQLQGLTTSLYYTTLYKGLEYLQIWVFSGPPGTNPLQIIRKNCINFRRHCGNQMNSYMY